MLARICWISSTFHNFQWISKYLYLIDFRIPKTHWISCHLFFVHPLKILPEIALSRWEKSCAIQLENAAASSFHFGHYFFFFNMCETFFGGSQQIFLTVCGLPFDLFDLPFVDYVWESEISISGFCLELYIQQTMYWHFLFMLLLYFHDEWHEFLRRKIGLQWHPKPTTSSTGCQTKTNLNLAFSVTKDFFIRILDFPAKNILI